MTERKSSTMERLRLLMEENDWMQKDILERCTPYSKKYGIALNKTDISNYVNGISEPRQNKLFILAKGLDVSEAWLMGCDVPRRNAPVINNLEPGEAELLTIYRQLSPSAKDFVNQVIAREIERGK